MILSCNHAYGISTFSVGTTPIPVVVNPNNDMIYVGNTGSNTVSVIDGSSNTIVTNVAVGTTPVALSIDTNANMVYVANLNSNDVSIIDTTTNTVVATIPVGISPTGISVDSNLKKVYVANTISGTVSVIDVLSGSPTKNSVTSTITLNSGARAVAVIPSNHEVVVTNGASNILYIIDGTTNTLIKTLNIGVAADPVTVDPTNSLVYTADLGTGTVTVVNGITNSVVASIPVGNNPDGIAVNSITKKVYVADFVDNAVAVIDGNTNTVVGEFQVSTPARLAVNEVTNKIYVNNLAFNSVTVLDGTAPNPPLANAGPDQDVTSGSIVTLSGSSTSPGTLSFSWTQTAGPAVTLSNANIANPTFTAPTVSTATLLTFQLTISDGVSTSVPSSVNIIVNPINTFTVNLLPFGVAAGNLAGSANIGNIVSGSTTTLLFNTPQNTLPFAQLEQNVIPSAVSGSGVSLNFLVSANTPTSLPTPPINPALFFDVTPTGIDFSQPSSFPTSESPIVRFQVNSNFPSQNRFSDGCPVVPILFFNENANNWQQIGDPQKPNTNKIFVPNTNHNTVSVIDGDTNAIIATIPVGSGPANVGFDTGNNMVYVPNKSDNTVSVIDETTNTVVATIPVGINPNAVAILPSINKVYVANGGDGTVSVIDTSPGSPTVNTVIHTIPVGLDPFELEANPSTNRVYVSNFFGDSVSVINANTDTVVATIPVSNLPGKIGVNPVTDKIYVANFFERIVWVIDGTPGSPTENSIISTITVGNNPTGITIDPSTNKMYVSNGFPNTVSVIDLSINTKIKTIPVGFDPTSVVINPNTKRLYTSNAISNTISVIDVLSGSPTENTVVSTIQAGDASVNADINSNVPNPVRDPSTDSKDGMGNIVQCSYLAILPHLSKFAVGGVVPALALLGSENNAPAPPSFSGVQFSPNEYPLTIDGHNFKLDSYTNTVTPSTFQVGKPVHLQLLLYENLGPDDVQGVALFTNLHGSDLKVGDSNTILSYDNDVTSVTDPDGFFKSVNIHTKPVNNKLEVDFDIVFANKMDASNLIIRSWDKENYKQDTQLVDAFQVVNSISNQESNSTFSDIIATNTPGLNIGKTSGSSDNVSIPVWVKNNAKWWAEGKMNNKNFLIGIQYMAQNDVVVMNQDDSILYKINSQTVPYWVKNNAKWWADGNISDAEFIKAIQYLIDNGIVNPTGNTSHLGVDPPPFR